MISFHNDFDLQREQRLPTSDRPAAIRLESRDFEFLSILGHGSSPADEDPANHEEDFSPAVDKHFIV